MHRTPSFSTPLVLGVTGHRNLDPNLLEPLRTAVRGLFRQLHCDYPWTPIVLLSPLATGADCLVAEVALESASDVQLVAVLPWPRALDAEIGTPEGERGCCEALINRALLIVDMPLPDHMSVETLRDTPSARENQFDEVGRYIARHCQILIAAWDGNAFATDSQTAKVVRYHAEGAPAPFSVRAGALDTVDQTAVCHFCVGRPAPATGSPAATASSAAGNAVVTPHWEWPAIRQHPTVRRRPRKWSKWIGWLVRSALLGVHRLRFLFHPPHAPHDAPAEHLLKQRWKMVDRYNQDVQQMLQMSQTAAILIQNRGYLVPDDLAGELPESVYNLREAYARADTVAGHWQKRTWRMTFSLFAVALLAIASLETYSHLSHEPYWLASYLGLLALGYGLFRWTLRQHHQGRWLDYRALAESLRVQAFWRWAGLPDSVADHYLRHFRGELDWIRYAVRAIDLCSGGHQVPELLPPATRGKHLRLVHKHWVADQLGYFQRSAPLHAEFEVSFETVARLSFAAAIGFAAYEFFHHLQTGHMTHELILLTFGSLLLAAFAEEYADVQAYSLLARRYHWMADLFQNAEARLQLFLSSDGFTSAHADQATELLFDLGREALAENADWVVQHRERPPSLPSG